MTVIASLVAVLAFACIAVLLLPVVADLISVFRIGRQPKLTGTAPPARFLFLIPAHNESGLITGCVRSVMNLNYPSYLVRAVVIADNCTDDTAAAARRAGAECLERFNTEQRGKPWAVKWALEQLEGAGHDAVIILDADAIVDPEYVNALNRAGPLRNKAIECYDDVRNPGESALTRMAAVLAAGRFRGSFALKQRAGVSVPLSDGMCLGADLLREHPWNVFSLSEDWELYAKLTAKGVTTELVSGAHLYAQETGTLRQSGTQRTRWLSGKLDALKKVGPELLRSTRIDWHQKIDVLGELAVPGPAVHLGVAVVLATLLLLTKAPGTSILLTGLALSLARPVVYALVGVAFVRERAATLASFTYLPIYTCWRLGVALMSVWPVRERPWLRTARE